MSIQWVAALTFPLRGQQQPTFLLAGRTAFHQLRFPGLFPLKPLPSTPRPWNPLLFPRPSHLTLVTANMKTAIQSNNSHSLLLTWLRHDGPTTYRASWGKLPGAEENQGGCQDPGLQPREVACRRPPRKEPRYALGSWGKQWYYKEKRRPRT